MGRNLGPAVFSVSSNLLPQHFPQPPSDHSEPPQQELYVPTPKKLPVSPAKNPAPPKPRKVVYAEENEDFEEEPTQDPTDAKDLEHKSLTLGDTLSDEEDAEPVTQLELSFEQACCKEKNTLYLIHVLKSFYYRADAVHVTMCYCLKMICGRPRVQCLL